MNIDQQRVLLAFAELNAKIGAARHPQLAAQLGAKLVPLTETTGYRTLRAWFVRLSPRARARAIAWIKLQIDGVNAAVAAMERAGEKFRYQDLADLAIEFKDPDAGAIPGLELEIERSCYGSGSGVPDIEQRDGALFVRCPRCEMRWEAHSVGFVIPPHQPVKGTDADPNERPAEAGRAGDHPSDPPAQADAARPGHERGDP